MKLLYESKKTKTQLEIDKEVLLSLIGLVSSIYFAATTAGAAHMLLNQFIALAGWF